MAYDISKVLTTIGVTVTVDGTEIVAAHDLGDFGGEPEKLDATPLSAHTQMNKSGLQQQDAWTISYFYNNADYATLEAKRTAGTSVPIVVTMNDGTVFSNTGVCTSNYVTAMGVNAMTEAQATFDLGNANGWTVTPPSP